MHGMLWSGCSACVVHSEWVVLLVVATLLLLTMADMLCFVYKRCGVGEGC